MDFLVLFLCFVYAFLLFKYFSDKNYRDDVLKNNLFAKILTEKFGAERLPYIIKYILAPLSILITLSLIISSALHIIANLYIIAAFSSLLD